MTAFVARLEVFPRQGVRDPQADAIDGVLGKLEGTRVHVAQVAKVLTLRLEASDAGAATARVNELCAQLLVNPVLEDFRVTCSSAP